MGTTLASAILSKASVLLQDATNVRWPVSELFGYLQDGQREVVIHRPEASARSAAVLLTANQTKQTIPSDGISFIQLVRNMGAAGTTPGKAVRLVAREIMDAQNPDWHSATNTVGYVQHYMYSPLDPKNYYVYPKAPATALYVELVYSQVPTLGATSSPIALDDIYASALLDYVMFRAYSKDAEYAMNSQLAAAYYTTFANSIGITTKTSVERNPNVLDSGTNPNVSKRS